MSQASQIQLVESEALAPDVVLVTVRGDADLRIAPRLRAELERLASDGWRHIVIDLSSAFFVDSAALGVLVAAAKRQRPRGGQLRIVTPTPHVRKLFELTLIDRLFEGLHSDVRTAARSFGS